MLGGLPPFRGNSEYIIFKKIEQLDFDFPETFHDQGKLLVKSLIKERDHELVILGNIFVNTVGTPNKKQLIFSENGSNRGNLGIPLFAIFDILSQIRENSLI